MNLSFKESIFFQSSKLRTLDEIIRDIKTGVHKEVVEEIRKEVDNSKRKDLKEGLPSFFVGVVFDDGRSSFNKSNSVSSTGIIQFDIDEYDIEKSKKFLKIINKEPTTLYSFISPFGGVKFGVMTNFSCNDKKTIKQKYKIAYEGVKEYLSKLLKGHKVDSSVQRISQQCYLSYDKDVYLNPNPEKILVNKPVNEIFSKWKKQELKNSKSRTSLIKNTDDTEVLDALGYIPTDLRYSERMTINFSIIDHFGVKSKPILMGHWSKSDRKKLENQIDSQIKSHTSGKISVGTLFHIAMRYGYRGNKVINQTNDKPTFYSEKYYTPDESSKRLEEIILEDFFENKKDKMVNVECGSGKTRTMFKVVSTFLLNNPNKKVSIFLKTHEMMDQFVEDMKENIKSYNKIQTEEKGFLGIRDQIPFYDSPHRIKGMGEVCKELDREGSGITRDNIGVIGTSKCSECFYQKVESCEYFDQYEKVLGKINNVRVYSHNRLFLKPKTDRNFKPDYVVIDEDIVSMMTDKSESLLSIESSQYPSIMSTLKDIGDGKPLSDSVKTRSSGDGLSKDYQSVKTELSILKNKLGGFTTGSLSPRQVGNYKILLGKINNKNKEKELFEELLLLSSGNKIQSKNVWIQHREGESPRLTYGKSKEILEEYKDIPMLYLDGSGEQMVVETLFDRDFEFENLRVKQQTNSRIYQFTNKSSFSKYSFYTDTDETKINEICDWIDTLETNSIGLIRYNQINGNTKFFEKLDKKINQVNGEDGLIGWFGNIRGINRFENCDTLIVLGQHRLPDYEIFNLSQLIFRTDVFGTDKKPEEESYSDYLKKEETKKVYRMKDGNHKQIKQLEYKKPECYFTSLHFDKSETYQSLHRLRLIHGTEFKQVYILSDTVLDVSVDKLLDRFKEFGDKNRTIIKYLKNNKFLIDTDDSFIQEFGWGKVETSEFRKNRSSGEWMKNHRSLLYWRYVTKNRQVGKVFSWKNQTSSGVQNWLETKLSIPIKSLTLESA